MSPETNAECSLPVQAKDKRSSDDTPVSQRAGTPAKKKKRKKRTPKAEKEEQDSGRLLCLVAWRFPRPRVVWLGVRFAFR